MSYRVADRYTTRTSLARHPLQKNAAGAEVAGFVDAVTAEEAVAKLKASGLLEVEVRKSPDSAQWCSGRSGLSETQAAQRAAFELRRRKEPETLTVPGEVERANRLCVMAEICLIAAGLALVPLETGPDIFPDGGL